MPPPSSLTIATSALQRLVKEEKSYHKELQQQEERVRKLESEKADADEDHEFKLRQERRAVEETKAVFPSLRARIKEALEKLQGQLEAEKEGEGASVEEITKAKEAVMEGTTALREVA
ncbi:MAG: hypothetical protein M1819_002468 [Sarea resinae]|nr:MAG: hypothetical protein M1819_002468 [Sarea resinae]